MDSHSRPLERTAPRPGFLARLAGRVFHSSDVIEFEPETVELSGTLLGMARPLPDAGFRDLSKGNARFLI